ncbi:unnamed protein product, partial [Ectocarpus fasciculatus]
GRYGGANHEGQEGRRVGDGRERGMPGGRAAQEEAFDTAQLQADGDGEEGVGDRPGQPLPAALSLGTFRRRFALRRRYQLRHLPRGEEDEPRRECDSSPAGGGERCRIYYGEGEERETLG